MRPHSAYLFGVGLALPILAFGGRLAGADRCGIAAVSRHRREPRPQGRSPAVDPERHERQSVRSAGPAGAADKSEAARWLRSGGERDDAVVAGADARPLHLLTERFFSRRHQAMHAGDPVRHLGIRRVEYHEGAHHRRWSISWVGFGGLVDAPGRFCLGRISLPLHLMARSRFAGTLNLMRRAPRSRCDRRAGPRPTHSRSRHRAHSRHTTPARPARPRDRRR